MTQHARGHMRRDHQEAKRGSDNLTRQATQTRQRRRDERRGGYDADVVATIHEGLLQAGDIPARTTRHLVERSEADDHDADSGASYSAWRR